MLPVASCLVPFLLLAHFSGASAVYFSKFLRQEESCPADAQERWSYTGDNGPQNWGQNYPECNGNSQSPINIDTAEVEDDPTLEKMQFVNYNVSVSSVTVINNGHTIQVTITDDVERTIEVEGTTYRLVQFHFHWGDRPKRGSEHTINNCSYAMELHFVHRSEDGRLAVVAVFFREGKRCNAELRKHGDILDEVQFRNQSTQRDNLGLNLNALLPKTPASFYRYNGSLTTPECTQGVTWTVLKRFRPICPRQMKRFRQLHSDTAEENNDACHIDNNFRPTQPLNGRVVSQPQEA